MSENYGIIVIAIMIACFVYLLKINLRKFRISESIDR